MTEAPKKPRFTYSIAFPGAEGYLPTYRIFDAGELMSATKIVRILEDYAELERRNVVLGRSSLTCPNCGSVLRCPMCGTDPGARLPKKGEKTDASDRL